MSYFLTQEQINYGRQHIKTLTQNVDCASGLANSKLTINDNNSNALYIEHNGWCGGNWNQGNTVGYGNVLGTWGRNTEAAPQFKLRCLKAFVPTYIIWNWWQRGKGWASRWNSIIAYSAGQSLRVLWNAVALTRTYTCSIPDDVLLNWDLAGNSWLELNLNVRSNDATYGGSVMIQGFQTPYPNIAAIKTEDTLHTPYQIVGYKDSKGNVHTAGRLL